jgi:hypothetical protein
MFGWQNDVRHSSEGKPPEAVRQQNSVTQALRLTSEPNRQSNGNGLTSKSDEYSSDTENDVAARDG